MSALRKIASKLYAAAFPTAFKQRSELKYWKQQYDEQHGELTNSHYEAMFTEPFSLKTEDFSGKKILDIGCGPRGSLEWAEGAAERVGLDPLAREYLKLGAKMHKMRYIASGSERIPFPDGHFDIVTCLNALDHVEDVHATIKEIKRTTRAGALFLLSVETDHPATATEPVTIDDKVLSTFKPEFAIETEFRVGTPADHDLHTAVKTRMPPHVPGEPGIYVARMRRT